MKFPWSRKPKITLTPEHTSYGSKRLYYDCGCTAFTDMKEISFCPEHWKEAAEWKYNMPKKLKDTICPNCGGPRITVIKYLQCDQCGKAI